MDAAYVETRQPWDRNSDKMADLSFWKVEKIENCEFSFHCVTFSKDSAATSTSDDFAASHFSKFD